MANIVRYEWDFGNGIKSNRSTPTSTFLPGVYTVSLKVWLDDGTIVTTTEDRYIKVSESNTSLLDKDCYIDTANKVSLHYGWLDSHGFNWSVNTGADFVFPESNAAIAKVTVVKPTISASYSSSSKNH